MVSTMDLKPIFYKTFANLPLGFRAESIVVVDEQPLSWNALKIEVDNNTDIGNKGLEILVQLGILKTND
jgi:hypothetical protein